ncbi:MAG: SdrD B-like domain-containing protein [Chloroflexota bacterium]
MSVFPWSGKKLSVLVLIFLLAIAVLVSALHVYRSARAADGDLQVSIIAGYNLVVDSNVTSPSTYSPSVATVIGKFCNTSTATLPNVVGYIGNYVDGTAANDTPGVYPARVANATFATQHTWQSDTSGSISYSFMHLGGTADAARYIGDIPAGQCKVQYWSFTYPRCENNGAIPCSLDPVWGATNNPNDDLWLDFDVWGKSTTSAGTVVDIDEATWKMTMRNEISAMANKIEPNPSGHWFTTDTNVVEAGEVITSNGVLYTFGNVNKGFDNDGDLQFDYNAWMQPFGDPSYDPSCFRLIRTTGTLTVTRGGAPDQILNFTDNLYFTNLPSDNTNVTGVVRYTFLALGGTCTTAMTPYQEAASGADNEKFNGDFGAGIPPIKSFAPEITVTKDGETTQSLGGTITYQIPFVNNGDGSAGLVLSTGGYGVDMPFTIEDSVPAGLQYDCGSALLSLGYTPGTAPGYKTLYSNDGGETWRDNESLFSTCPGTDPTSTAAAPIVIRWQLTDPLPAMPGSGNNTSYGTATFRAIIPASYTGSTLIENEACANLGGASLALDCDEHNTLVRGSSSIGDFVWRDLDGDGAQDGGSETGIDGIGVSLYWDANNNNALDDGDALITSTVTASGGAYDFTFLPNGSYLVVVDAGDSDLPTGFSNTTRVVLDADISTAGTDDNTADFGFAPALQVDKALVSTSPVGEGSPVVFDITLTNTRPEADGSYCTYPIWATIAHGDNTLTPPGGNNANSQWTNPNNTLNEPDRLYATTGMRNTADVLGLSGFNLAGKTGSIRSVKLRLYFTEVTNFQAADSITVDVWRSDARDTTNQFIYNGATHFTGAAGTEYMFETAALNGTWTWANFSANASELQLTTSSSPTSGDIGLDAAAYIVTTNEPCGGGDDVVATLPLTDTYDADLLQFVSASPSHSTAATSGTAPNTTGTVVWSNLGPLSGGESRVVRVTFLALDPAAVSASTVNTATVSGAKFGSGRAVNDGQDTAPVTINRTAVIGDRVWNDTANPGVQDAGEVGVPGVTVRLCSSAACTTVLETTTTNASGYYSFTVTDGSYYVNVPTAPGTFTYDDDGATNGNGTAAVTVTGSDDLTLDFGYTLTTASVYGMLWEDLDGDGVKDASEPFFSGVTVRLCTASTCSTTGGNTVVATTTDANGGYSFLGVSTATPYYISVDTSSLPNGATGWTQTEDPDTTFDSRTTAAITFPAGVNGSYDFAYRRTPTVYGIGDTLFTDWDGDGAQDTGEEGIANATVRLYFDRDRDGALDAGDPLAAATTTDTNGNYLFPNLGADYYIVVVDGDSLPAGYVQTADPSQSGVCGVCDNRYNLNFAGTANVLSVDFGYRPSGGGSIGDYVWKDANGDGVQDAAETGIANVTVTLYEDSNANGSIDADDAVVAVTTSDADGAYLFENLPYGRYLVDVDTADSDLPTNAYGNRYLLTTGNDPTLIVLNAGSPNNLTADFGFAPPGAIGDLIWQDNNANGLQDAGEPGLGGVTVNLYTYTDSNGNGQWDSGETRLLVGSDATDAAGLYEFTGLPPSDYYVVEVGSGVPAGYLQTYDPDAPVSAIGCASGCNTNASLTLAYGQINHTADFAYRPLGRIGDTLWVDLNNDGVRQDTEPGLSGAAVYLCDSSDTPPCTGANANYTTSTDGDGHYAFGGIGDGNWFVSVSTPANYAQTYETNDATPDGTIEVTLSGGDVSSVGGTACTACSMDVDFGYRYDLSGAYTLSGTVFYDAGGDGGAYAAGTDVPYPGITVSLYDATTGALIATTTTVTGTNTYQFSGLPAGNYRVAFNKAGQLNLLTITTEPDDSLCTNVGSACNNWTQVSLSGNTANVDFGLYALMDCGDLPSTYNVSAYQYGTQLAANGPCHIHTTDRNADLNPSEHYMGSVDYEPDGQPNSTATGDGSDENGVVRAPYELWTPNTTVHLTVTVTGDNAYLAAWFDWNRDGDFNDSGEYRYYGQLAEGARSLPLVLPSNCCTGSTNTLLNVRFRLYQGFSPPAVIAPTGVVVDGEVEDYQWAFSPTHVTVETATAYTVSPVSWFSVPIALVLLLAAFVGFRKARRLAAS